MSIELIESYEPNNLKDKETETNLSHRGFVHYALKMCI